VLTWPAALAYGCRSLSDLDKTPRRVAGDRTPPNAPPPLEGPPATRGANSQSAPRQTTQHRQRSARHNPRPGWRADL